ncbi:hypothetical protein NPIL_613271 [Nephila pilipes]|uniref:Uncharacterized protein n=1 Tax=Nephila pilipes TaxID=299642 RepID=A0A8X6R015_NEPPI|nr:hypothetical protein NPIL_613271 [Nephila pilipes]
MAKSKPRLRARVAATHITRKETVVANTAGKFAVPLPGIRLPAAIRWHTHRTHPHFAIRTAYALQLEKHALKTRSASLLRHGRQSSAKRIATHAALAYAA